VTSTIALSPIASRVPEGKAQVEGFGCDVLAHVACADFETLRGEFIEQFGVNEMDLPQIRLGRIPRDTRTVFHRRTGMGFILDAKPFDQPVHKLIGPAKSVLGVAADRNGNRHR